MQEMILYYKPFCPYCRKVLAYMESNKIYIPKKNTQENSEYRKELLEIAGRTQVPCLVIDGEPKHESDAIIEWMKANLKNDA